MRRLIIAVDCDDVLVASTELIVTQYNKQYGTAISLDSAHDHGVELWNADDKKTVIDRITAIQIAHKPTPLKAAVDILRSLARQHELHMITARPIEAELVTLELIKDEFDGVFTSIEHVGHEGSKGEVCGRIQADVLIDDNLRHLEDALGYGVSKVLWFGDYPWQKQDLPAGVERCRDWVQVGEFFERTEF